MAYPFTDTPKIGVILTNIQEPVADQVDPGAVNEAKSHRLGSQIWGVDGRRWVYAQAGGAIAANVTVATVNATTFIASATGGAYKSPPFAMVAGDRAWFSAASA